MISIVIIIIEYLLMSIFHGTMSSIPTFIIAINIGIFSIGYFIDLACLKKFKAISIPLMIGYLLRVFLIFFDLYGKSIFPLPGSGGDSENFYAAALTFANGNKSSYGGLFSEITGILISWVGSNRLFVQFTVMLFSIAALHIIGSTIQRVQTDIVQQRRTMWCICVLPYFSVLSSIFLRESCIIMLLAASLYFFVEWYQKKKEIYFLFSIFFVMGASMFHSGTIGVAVGYFVGRFLYNAKKEQFQFTVKNTAFVVCGIFIFIYLYNNYSDILFAKMSNMESIEDIASGGGRGESSYAFYVGNSSSIFNMIIYSIPRMLYFSFSPFPWQWRGIIDIIAFCFSSMFYIWIWIRTFRYLKNGKKKNRNLIILLVISIIITVFIFGWGVSNTGTALRHRDKLIPFYALLLALTWKNQKNMRS